MEIFISECSYMHRSPAFDHIQDMMLSCLDPSKSRLHKVAGMVFICRANLDFSFTLVCSAQS